MNKRNADIHFSTTSMMNQQCSFCDRPADTREHVIPQWLQNHYKLGDEKLSCWNETSIPYRQAVIPACSYCNNERFSRLENKVRENTANDQELYLWALKIRYGLALKDSSLRLDRKAPELGALLSPEIVAHGEPFIRHAFQALDDKKFRFNPFPFGSVFRFHHSPATPEQFDFVDVPAPYWALAIKLPTRETLVVLFADRGVTKKIMRRYAPLKGNFEKVAHHVPMASARFFLFQLLRWQVRLVIPSGVRTTNQGMQSERIPRKIRTRQPELEGYREIAANCGLPDEVAYEAFSRDIDTFQVPYLLRY